MSRDHSHLWLDAKVNLSALSKIQYINMPPTKKRSKRAKAQRASGGRFFTNGLADTLLNLVIDPTYVPSNTSGSEDESSASGDDRGWAQERPQREAG